MTRHTLAPLTHNVRRSAIATEPQTNAPTSPAQAAPDAAKSDARVEQARQFAINVARLAAHTRCHSVVVLDLQGLSPVCDFFVLATGTSARQMRTVADEAIEYGGHQGFSALSTTGYEGENWILVDFVDVVLHVFNDESRQFYDLDNLWGDAKPVEWQGPPPVLDR